MKMLAPSDNGLFLVHWRERTRPEHLVTAGIMTVALLVIVIASCYAFDDTAKEVWPRWAFGVISIFQGGVIIVLGSYMAGHRANREVKNQTIDFHRISPTSRFHQVWGLTIGAPSLEWCAFGLTLPISAVMAFMGKVSVSSFANLYGSLILSSIFFHTVAVALGLSVRKAKPSARDNAIGISVPVALFMASWMSVPLMSSASYHMTSLPVYLNVLSEVFVNGDLGIEMFEWSILNTFYGLALPSIVLQLIVQVPFTILAGIAVTRAISRPERSVFSKLHILIGTALMLALFVGVAYSIMGDDEWGANEDVNSILRGALLYIVMLMGIAGAWMITPEYLPHLKGLRRMRKLGREQMGSIDDSSSNCAWLTFYALLSTVAYGAVLMFHMAVPDLIYMIVFPLVLCYVLWYAGALEYFRLGRFHRFKSLFAVLMAVPWIFIPVFGIVMAVAMEMEELASYLVSPSPIMGLFPILVDADLDKSEDLTHVIFTVSFNALLAIITMLAAARQRIQLRAKAD